MGTTVSKNAQAKKTGTPGITASDSEDDDAGGGIRGPRPSYRIVPSHGSRSTPSQAGSASLSAPPSAPLYSHSEGTSANGPIMTLPKPPVTDPLDVAIVESVREIDVEQSVGSTTAPSDIPKIGQTLDRYLGRSNTAALPTSTSTSPARGHLVPREQGRSARDSLKSSQTVREVQPLKIPTRLTRESALARAGRSPTAAVLKTGSEGSAGSASSSGSTDSAASLTSDGGSASSHDSILTPENVPNDYSLSRGRRTPSDEYINECLVDDLLSSGTSASLKSLSDVGGSSYGLDAKGRPVLTTGWLNNAIRRICVAGLQAKRSHRFVLSPEEIKLIARASAQQILAEPVLLELASPVKVVGDIHGQFKDLMRIFRKCGMPPKTNYLFLGDYVDRGRQSLETLMLLLCLKLRYPGSVFLLRGNHECASVTKVYGFYDECKRRSNLKSWRHLVDVFNTLPIAATIGGKIFCVHGGLSPYLSSLEDIERVQRPTDVPDGGLVSDLLWSDPDGQVLEWADNDRGVSFLFGRKVLDRFCHEFGFDLVARGHMVVEDGYEFFDKRKLVTIFSAPNYVGDFDNWGAVMSVSKELVCSFELIEPITKNTSGPASPSVVAGMVTGTRVAV